MKYHKKFSMEELEGKFDLGIIIEDSNEEYRNNQTLENSILYNDANYFDTNTDIPFQTVEETVLENKSNELTDLNNAELHTETLETEATDDNSYLPMNLESNVSLDLEFKLLPFSDSSTLTPELVDDTDLEVDMKMEAMKCRNSDQEICLNYPDPVNRKGKLDNDLMNLNAKCLLSNWRERIKSTLLYCKQCAISFQDMPKLLSHNNFVHKSELKQTFAEKVKEMTVKPKSMVNKKERKRKSVNGSTRKNHDALFCKNRKSKPCEKNEDLDVKDRRPKRKAKLSKRTDVLARKGNQYPMVPITDLTVTMKQKDGRKQKLYLKAKMFRK